MSAFAALPMLKIIDAEMQRLKTPGEHNPLEIPLERLRCLDSLRKKVVSELTDSFSPMRTAPRDGRQILLALDAANQYKFCCGVYLPAAMQWGVSSFEGQVHYFLENQCVGWAWLPYSDKEYMQQMITRGNA